MFRASYAVPGIKQMSLQIIYQSWYIYRVVQLNGTTFSVAQF